MLYSDRRNSVQFFVTGIDKKMLHKVRDPENHNEKVTTVSGACFFLCYCAVGKEILLPYVKLFSEHLVMSEASTVKTTSLQCWNWSQNEI